MRYFFILCITFYQRFISPYKGCRCAYGYYHPSLSCSGQVKHILAEHGVIAGWSLIWLQFRQCRAAYEALTEAKMLVESNRQDRHHLLRPISLGHRQQVKSAVGRMYFYLPIGTSVARPSEMGFVCCFII